MDRPQMLKIFVLYICRSRFIGSIFIPEHWTHLSMMPRSWNIWWPKMKNVNCLLSEPGLQWRVMVPLFQEIPNIFIISIEKLWIIVKMVCTHFVSASAKFWFKKIIIFLLQYSSILYNYWPLRNMLIFQWDWFCQKCMPQRKSDLETAFLIDGPFLTILLLLFMFSSNYFCRFQLKIDQKL